ncbi:hypothetical protein QTO34_001343 [Cnephaeus nilssonii]|uniref:Uncharacterized protein n=1 Tax=Cnephaeus nilssonii TaxID=3371016 RepID=A0AA40HVN3_CNENI|nr:hypothetical protein QTO34_001343 [Eptesicus nilssonii]
MGEGERNAKQLIVSIKQQMFLVGNASKKVVEVILEIGELLLSQTQVIAGAAGSSRCHEWKETHVLSVLQQYNTQKKMVVKTNYVSEKNCCKVKIKAKKLSAIKSDLDDDMPALKQRHLGGMLSRYAQERVKRIEEMEGFKTATPGLPLYPRKSVTENEASARRTQAPEHSQF